MQILDSSTHRVERSSHQSEAAASLVLRAKQDPHAFAPLYDRYRDDVLRYTTHCLGDREDAADATQQTFTNALSGLSGFQGTDDSFRCWLFRIARNEVIDRHRQRARRPEFRLSEAGLLEDAGNTPEEHAVLADAHAATEALFQRLPREQRRCCQLHLAGLTHRETAILLGKSEVAVRASYCRGMATLRGLMASAGHCQ